MLSCAVGPSAGRPVIGDACHTIAFQLLTCHEQQLMICKLLGLSVSQLHVCAGAEECGSYRGPVSADPDF